MEFFKGFLSILSGKIGLLFLSVLSTPILVRLLGSQQYGNYAFLLSTSGIVLILINAGINDGLRKYVAEDRPDSNWDDNVFAFYTRFGILLAGISLTIFTMSNVSGFTSRVLGDQFDIYLYLTSIWVIGNQLFSIARSSLMGKGKEHISESIRFLRKASFVVLALSLAYLNFGVIGVLTGHILASIVAICMISYYIFRFYDIGFLIKPAPDDFPSKTLLTYNHNTVLLLLTSASLYHSDILLLQTFSGSSATGYYKAALVIAEFIWFVPAALQAALIHSTSEMWFNDDRDKISELSSKITRYTLCIVLIIIIGLFILSEPFVTLYYGEEFRAAVIPLQILLPGALGFAISRPIYAFGQGRGNLKPLIAATGGAAAINLLLNIILIPRLGMSGAAIATSIGYGSMVLFHGVAAIKMGYNPFTDIRLGKIGFSSAIIYLVLFVIKLFLGNGLLALVIIPPVGLWIYSILLVKTGALSKGEIKYVLSKSPTLVSRVVYSLLPISNRLDTDV